MVPRIEEGEGKPSSGGKGASEPHLGRSPESGVHILVRSQKTQERCHQERKLSNSLGVFIHWKIVLLKKGRGCIMWGKYAHPL